MTRPPRRPATTQRKPRPVLQQVWEAPAAETSEPVKNGFDADKAVADFEAALREQPGFDEGALEEILGQYREAVQNVSLEPNLTPVLDRQTLVETVGLLARNQSITEEECAELLRRFDEAMEPLQRRDVQIALEYAERCNKDGEEKALEWLKQQNASSSEDAETDASIDPEGQKPFLRQAITKSKARRLRGPPTGR